MRLIVVNDEADLADLRRRVLRPGLAANARASVEDQIRLANPHLDLDRLSRGTVVALPDLPEIADDASENGAATYLAVLDQLSDALGRPPRPTRPSLGRPALRAALASTELRAVVDLDATLAAEVSRLDEALTAEEGREAERTDASEAAVAGWRTALGELRDALRATPGPADR